MGRMLQTTGFDDQDHLAVIGAGGLMPNAPKIQMAMKPNWMGFTSPQGVSAPNEELDFLPLGKADSGVLAAAGDFDGKLEGNPQRPFRGERVVLMAIHYTAAPGPVASQALWRVIITPAIYVGASQVGATQGDMPGSAFDATAFGVRLSFPSAGQGTRIYIPFTVPALLLGERIIISGGIFGRAVR